MKNYKMLLLLPVICAGTQAVGAQFFMRQPVFTHQDTLRGSVTPERAWWDLKYYHLSVDVDINNKSISGTNLVRYRVLDADTPQNRLQIDLQQPMQITGATQDGNELRFVRDGNAYFISLIKEQRLNDVNELLIRFEGTPREAIRPPWDGGFTWAHDSAGKPFVANSNQGIGASLWWPNKDHAYDEPDSMKISITAPEELTDVSNGRLLNVTENGNGTKTWNWTVVNPINNYGVNLNIADYAHFGEIYRGEKGELDMNYYVLHENLEKAVRQFADAPRMMEAFEYWFGPYPFYEDGYKLVEAPYLGMEHQSSVTYGNKFENGYLGRDLSRSGWGLKFDFIIIHESAHEWFANNITAKDVADMWVHEGFACYAESLFLEYYFGAKAAEEYIRGIRQNILNDRPMIGIYNVNYEGSSDMYYKGSNMLHTIRQVINDDVKWRNILRGLNKEFYHQTVTTDEVEEYISKVGDVDLSSIFDQYLRDYRVPVLEHGFKEGKLIYRWANTIAGFNMPIRVFVDGEAVYLAPLTSWQELPLVGKELKVDSNYYVGSMNILGN